MEMFERSRFACRTYSDEHIELWGEVYLANPQLRARGVLFEAFLLAPAKILDACARPFMVVSRSGLLPAQRRARLAADTQSALQELGERALAKLAAEAHCANGRWVEKMRHHAWSARRGDKREVLEIHA